MRHFASWGLVLSTLTLSLADPIAKPEAIPQQLTNNAPFSGAVYIVNPNGQQFVAQGTTNLCPASASVSCSNVNQPSWCCPTNYVCAVPGNSNGLIGCCPSGSTCGGVVNVAQITTVTVYSAQQTPVPYLPPAQTTVYNTPNPVQPGGYCQTLTMVGDGLPREAPGRCGTILIVAADTSRMMLSIGVVLCAVLSHVAFGRLFNLA